MLTNIALYFIAFNIVTFFYSSIIASQYSYIGLIDDFSLQNYFVSIIALAGLTFLCSTKSRTKSFFYHLCMSTLILPLFIIGTNSGRDLEFLIVCIVCFIFFVITSKAVRVPTLKFQYIPEQRIALVCMILALVILGAIISVTGLRYVNFNIYAVYEFRSDISSSLPTILQYLNPMATAVLVPISFLIYLQMRNYKMAALAALLSVMFFAITSHKSPLFVPIVLVVVWFLSNSRRPERLLILAIAGGAITSLFDMYLYQVYIKDGANSFGIFGDLFLRRSLLIPAHLTYLYYDLFYFGEQYHWAMSRITFGLVTPPYDLAPPRMVGFTYYGRAEVAANTGWIGSGIANAGIYGAIFYSIILGLVVSYIDNLAKRVGHQTIIALFFMSMLTLFKSSDLFTTFITHGLLVLLLAASFIPKRRNITSVRTKFAQPQLEQNGQLIYS